MISLRKCQFSVRLVVVLACVTALSQEPNETKTGLQFEIGREEQEWIADLDELQMDEMYEKIKVEKSVIRPTHVAVMHIEHVRVPVIHWPEISNSPIGRTMSERQREFIDEANGRIRNLQRIEDGFEFRWYAVSENDAKKMAQAFLEVWTHKVNPKLQPVLNQRTELEQKISQAKKELPEKEAESRAINAKYEEIKKITHDLSLHSDAAKESKETILEMNKKLDAINIEIKGIEAKLSAIEQYKSKKNVSIEGLSKLEQILCEQAIELAGALARQEAVIQIRTREEDFYSLHRKWSRLNSEVSGLRRNIASFERNLKRVKEILANPEPDMRLPMVLQDRATIYPVATK